MRPKTSNNVPVVMNIAKNKIKSVNARKVKIINIYNGKLI